LILPLDTKSIVEAHTVWTTQVDQNRTFYNGVRGRTKGL